MNPASLILGRFMQMQRVPLQRWRWLGRAPSWDHSVHFLEKLSVHSARGWIKKECSRISLEKLCEEISTNHAHHLHLLPSILTPEMPYPLVSMCRSVHGHRLANWNISLVRLQVYDLNDLPLCWCGAMYDCLGDHAFCCRKNNKKMAYTFCIEGTAKG